MGAVVVLTILATLACGGGVYAAFSGKLGGGLSALMLLCSAMVGACAFAGDDVQALWESRSENRSYMGLGRGFVEPAMRGGSAPDSLVGEWLSRGLYAPRAAAYATNVSEGDVLRIVRDASNQWRNRALMSPVLSREALWNEMRRRRGWDAGLTCVFSNERAPRHVGSGCGRQ